jgi:hypothetical protein
MNDKELKEFETTIHQKQTKNINYRKEFGQNMVEMYKRQLEFTKELLKKAFEGKK